MGTSCLSTAPITGYPNHMHHSSLISLTRMPALSSAHIKAKTHQTFSIDFQALFRNFENSWLKLKIIKLQLILFWCPLHWGSHHFSTKFTSFSSGPIHKENTKACNCIKSAKNLDNKKKNGDKWLKVAVLRLLLKRPHNFTSHKSNSKSKEW